MFEHIEPVTITPRAAAEIRKIMQTKNIPEGYGLRIGMKGGGCGGATLILGFDKKKESDQEFSINEITVYIDKKHTLYLIGKEVDFLENENARGFMFVDPGKEVETS
jgi:iron-sulfur cluster assembly protein